MSEYLPFLPRFRPLIQNGVKVATARTRKYGEPGSLVNSPCGVLRILSVRKERLEDIANLYWKEEGAESPEDFQQAWNQLHPGRGWTPDLKVWFHLFEVVK